MQNGLDASRGGSRLLFRAWGLSVPTCSAISSTMCVIRQLPYTPSLSCRSPTTVVGLVYSNSSIGNMWVDAETARLELSNGDGEKGLCAQMGKA